MKRSLILAAAVLVVAGLASSSASASGANRLHGCGKIADVVVPSKVSAAQLPCGRALNVAAKFVQRDRVAEGWKPFNPAGCEWLMYKKHDKHAFRQWFFDGGPLDFKLIGFTKARGCVS